MEIETAFRMYFHKPQHILSFQILFKRLIKTMVELKVIISCESRKMK